MSKKIIATLVVALCTKMLFAQNLALNPDFEKSRIGTHTPTGQCWSKAGGVGLNGNSAAENWTIWLGTTQPDACMITDLVKVGSNCIPPSKGVSGMMMYAKTTYGDGGLVASLSQQAKTVKFSCWVYVVKGKVGMGVGDGGNTSCSASSTSTCKWEFLEGTSTTSLATQIIIYSLKKDAEFYVDGVVVEEI